MAMKQYAQDMCEVCLSFSIWMDQLIFFMSGIYEYLHEICAMYFKHLIYQPN